MGGDAAGNPHTHRRDPPNPKTPGVSPLSVPGCHLHPPQQFLSQTCGSQNSRWGGDAELGPPRHTELLCPISTAQCLRLGRGQGCGDGGDTGWGDIGMGGTLGWGDTHTHTRCRLPVSLPCHCVLSVCPVPVPRSCLSLCPTCHCPHVLPGWGGGQGRGPGNGDWDKPSGWGQGCMGHGVDTGDGDRDMGMRGRGVEWGCDRAWGQGHGVGAAGLGTEVGLLGMGDPAGGTPGG